jgi:hypothetical protein
MFVQFADTIAQNRFQRRPTLGFARNYQNIFVAWQYSWVGKRWVEHQPQVLDPGFDAH